MPKKKDSKELDSLLRWGLSVLFISLAVLLGYLLFNYFKLTRTAAPKTTAQQVDQDDSVSTAEEIYWEEFKNDNYGFEIAHPKLMYQHESEDTQNYLYFVRFEETAFSHGKGVAVGVTKRSKAEEAEQIKTSFKDNYRLDPKSESEVKIGNGGGVRLDYLPEGDLEARSFLIVDTGGFTYSVSTSPEQFDKVASSLAFF